MVKDEISKFFVTCKKLDGSPESVEEHDYHWLIDNLRCKGEVIDHTYEYDSKRRLHCHILFNPQRKNMYIKIFFRVGYTVQFLPVTPGTEHRLIQYMHKCDVNWRQYVLDRTVLQFD